MLNKRKLTRTACEVIFFEVQNKHIFDDLREEKGWESLNMNVYMFSGIK